MFIETKNICACQTDNRHRLKVFVSVLFFISLMPAVLAKTVIEYNNGAYDDVVVVMPKSENAKGYTVQVDDNINFMSPVIERKITADREKLVFRLRKMAKPYYWRYQMEEKNGSFGDWQNQLELRNMVPPEDKLFFMEGNDYQISEPIGFYFYIRNDSDQPNAYEYDISIRTDAVVDKETTKEVKDVIFGKVNLGPRSSKLIKTEMKTEDDLEVNKKYYAVARVNEYSATEDFNIIPSYKADILTKELEKGTGKKVKLYITNTGSEALKTLKVNMSTSYNLQVEKWWDNREAAALAPGGVEYFEWDVKVLELGKSEVDFDVLSDGGTQRLQKVFMPYSGSLVAKEMPGINVAINEISNLKIRVANISETPVADDVELVIAGNAEAEGKIEVLEKNQEINVGSGSNKCSIDLTDDCSGELSWRLIGKEVGTYEYYLRSGGYDIKPALSEIVRSGKINVKKSIHILDITIDGEADSETKTSNKGPFNYDITINNRSSNSDSVKIKIISEGKGWYVHFYDGKELLGGDEFTAEIGAESSKNFLLVLNPYSTDSGSLGKSVTNPFGVRVSAISAASAENYDEVRIFAKVE